MWLLYRSTCGCSWVSPAELGADPQPSSMSPDTKDAASAGRVTQGSRYPGGPQDIPWPGWGCPEGAPDPAARPRGKRFGSADAAVRF